METAQIFQPESTSRQGERNAWILTGFAIIIELLMIWRFSKPLGWMALLAVLLLACAIFISLSNWVDRKTVLILKPDGVEFHNGLRDAQLSWDQIEKISIIEDRWGQRVHVSGTETHFNFRMLSEVELRGKVGGKMGFPDGENILKDIINTSGLSLAENKDHDRYYVRP